jgi:ribose 5-phosphate isomerase A
MKWENKIATTLEWTSEISNREAKEKVAEEMALRVREGDVIGVGSGSTAFLAIQAIARKVHKENLNVTAIPTSAEVSLTCSILGLKTSSLLNLKPDWAFDGADEVDPKNNLIKGRGGAMFHEKLVMKSSRENYILVDDSKLVNKLGEKFAIPVEIYPSAIHLVEENLNAIGAIHTKLRLAKSKDGPVITEAGNFIVDVKFNEVTESLEKEIKQIPGVIETGLFLGYDVKIITS